jgi:hypothetical protein
VFIINGYLVGLFPNLRPIDFLTIGLIVGVSFLIGLAVLASRGLELIPYFLLILSIRA